MVSGPMGVNRSVTFIDELCGMPRRRPVAALVPIDPLSL
jgi:hypothetical protein